ncbi:ribbon-helix-helix protein, CopG family [Candidatus Woesearchaeota archaeon]|nr:ribbon-helix-helix protein, CopG family [Candidatus Woesearchaeota archaeon]
MANLVLDKETDEELNALRKIDDKSRSEIVREAVRDLYLKEKRARENFRFFIDLYREGAINKDMLFILLPRKDAEAMIIGAKVGKDAAKIAKNLGY